MQVYLSGMEVGMGTVRLSDADVGALEGASRLLLSPLEHPKLAFEQDAVFVRTSGGTVPISPFVTELGLPATGIPTVNPDNNQHAPNENVRIGHFTDGIRTLISVLTH